MKKIILATLAALLCVTLSAQKGPADKAKAEVAKFKTELSLTDEQVTQVQKLYIQRLNAVNDLTAKNLSKEEAKVEKAKIISKFNKQLSAVLSPEQMTKFKEYQKQAAQAAKKPAAK